jgi:hypothetical protein
MLLNVLADTFSDGRVLCILLAKLAGLLSKARFAWRDSFAFDPSAHVLSPSPKRRFAKQYDGKTIRTINLVSSTAICKSLLKAT